MKIDGPVLRLSGVSVNDPSQGWHKEATLSSAGVSATQTAAGCYCHISSTNQWTVSANACKEPINPNWGWHEGERCRGEGEWEDMYSSNKQALSAPPRGNEQKSCFLLHADKPRLPETLSSAQVKRKIQPHILFSCVICSRSPWHRTT